MKNVNIENLPEFEPGSSILNTKSLITEPLLSWLLTLLIFYFRNGNSIAKIYLNFIYLPMETLEHSMYFFSKNMCSTRVL